MCDVIDALCHASGRVRGDAKLDTNATFRPMIATEHHDTLPGLSGSHIQFMTPIFVW